MKIELSSKEISTIEYCLKYVNAYASSINEDETTKNT
jgi:hypothetical protein